MIPLQYFKSKHNIWVNLIIFQNFNISKSASLLGHKREHEPHEATFSRPDSGILSLTTSVKHPVIPSIRFAGGFFSSGNGSKSGMEGATAGGISRKKEYVSATCFNFLFYSTSHAFCLLIQGFNQNLFIALTACFLWSHSAEDDVESYFLIPRR